MLFQTIRSIDGRFGIVSTLDHPVYVACRLQDGIGVRLYARQDDHKLFSFTEAPSTTLAWRKRCRVIPAISLSLSHEFHTFPFGFGRYAGLWLRWWMSF